MPLLQVLRWARVNNSDSVFCNDFLCTLYHGDYGEIKERKAVVNELHTVRRLYLRNDYQTDRNREKKPTALIQEFKTVHIKILVDRSTVFDNRIPRV